MNRIIIYEEERPDIKISMELYFKETGQLVFEGYDIGERVKEIWGDVDYEYFYTIEPVEVKKLYSLLAIAFADRAALLQAVKERFGGNSAYSLFGNFMRENNIIFSSYTWI